MSEKKVKRKVKTTVEVDRETWGFVKYESALTGEKTGAIVERALKEYKRRQQRKE